MNTNDCSIDDCHRPRKTRGWCEPHYKRWRRHGDPEARAWHATPEGAFLARTEPLLWDGCLIWTGGRTSSGYGHISVHGTVMPAHRYAWERVNGPIPDGMVVDHRYHCDRACVEVGHLRLATRVENRRNQNGASRSSATGHRNVYHHREGWYRVTVRKGGRRHGGTHQSIEAAIAEALALREELFGDYAGRG